MSEYKFDRLNLNTDLVPAAKLYAEVFAGPPWNEYTQCSKCDSFFGLDTEAGQACQIDGGNLQLAYPLDFTTGYITKECTRPDALAFTARTKDGLLVASAWGYSFSSPEQFAKEKWSEEMRDTVTNLLVDSGIQDKFFYFSECGVREPFRGRGIASRLSKLRFETAREQGFPIVTRTSNESPIVAISQRLGMTQVMGPRVEADPVKRQIISYPEAINDIVDSTIPARVLFVLR